MSNDIVFRRIRGRIVPIKLNNAKKEQIKGAGIAAAGVVVAVEGGQAFKKISYKAIDKAIKSKQILEDAIKPGEFTGIKNKFKSVNQMSFDDVLKANAYQSSAKTMAAAKKLGRLAQGIRKYSPYVGGALIGYGTAKFLSNYAKDKKKTVSPEVIAALGVTAGSAGLWGAKHAEDIFTASVARGRQGAFKFASSNVLSKLKDIGKTFVKAKF